MYQKVGNSDCKHSQTIKKNLILDKEYLQILFAKQMVVTIIFHNVVACVYKISLGLTKQSLDSVITVGGFPFLNERVLTQLYEQ